MCEESTKKCASCKTEKLKCCFSKDDNRKDKLYPYCKECSSKAKKASREKNKARQNVVIPETKHCPGCNIEKTSSDFYKADRNGDGLGDYCKKCCSKSSKILHEKNGSRDNIAIPDYKSCPGCNTRKPGSEFNVDSSVKDGLKGYCKECQAIRLRKSRYGLTPEQFNAMLLAQGGACAICKWIPGPEDYELDVDHIHGTEIVRGLLHSNCNRGLGFFKDSANLIHKAIGYLNSPDLGVRYKTRLDKATKEKILSDQNYMCKICSVDLHDKRVHFDHDHLTNMIRGALCHGCNCGLGQFDDSVVLLQKAADYLVKSEGTTC